MSIKIKGFLRAVTVTQALAYAAQYPGETVYLAGGTDVMVQAREDDRFAQKYLVDITGIRELTGISQTADTLQIGALATMPPCMSPRWCRNMPNCFRRRR